MPRGVGHAANSSSTFLEHDLAIGGVGVGHIGKGILLEQEAVLVLQFAGHRNEPRAMATADLGDHLLQQKPELQANMRLGDLDLFHALAELSRPIAEIGLLLEQPAQHLIVAFGRRRADQSDRPDAALAQRLQHLVQLVEADLVVAALDLALRDDLKARDELLDLVGEKIEGEGGLEEEADIMFVAAPHQHDIGLGGVLGQGVPIGFVPRPSPLEHMKVLTLLQRAARAGS